MVTAASIEAMIRECSMFEEHLSAQLADAERDAPDRVASLLDLVRELKAELIAAHPTRLRDTSSRTRRGPDATERPLQPPAFSLSLVDATQARERT